MEKTYICIELIIFSVDSSFIAFNAYMKKTLKLHFNTPVNVVYDGLYFNYGNAYNPHTGVFTAPSKGLYVFTWTSLTDSKMYFNAEILVNGQRKGLGNCRYTSTGHESCETTVPLVLKTGDTVILRTTNANHLFPVWSSFKGWKV